MRNKNQSLVAVVVLSAVAVAMSSAGVLAQGHGRGHGPKASKTEHKAEHKAGKKAEHAADHAPVAVAIDRDGHTRVVREYARAGSLPPGLAKREALPPGLREQLRERGELPPGLQKRLIPVPGTLVTRLPAVPSYYHRYFAGDDLIVVDTRTNRIAAVIRDVWR